MPDDLVIQLLRGRLAQLEAVTKGWVLHGFPKTREQAESLGRAGYEPNRSAATGTRDQQGGAFVATLVFPPFAGACMKSGSGVQESREYRADTTRSLLGKRIMRCRLIVMDVPTDTIRCHVVVAR